MGWGDGPVVRTLTTLAEGSGFNYQHPHGCVQQSDSTSRTFNTLTQIDVHTKHHCIGKKKKQVKKNFRNNLAICINYTAELYFSEIPNTVRVFFTMQIEAQKHADFLTVPTFLLVTQQQNECSPAG